MFGAADCMISVKRDAVNNIVTTVQHMKDGEPGEPMVDRLESVTVGTDDDGDPITTCIVKRVDGQAVEPDTRKRGSDRDVLAMEALTEALLKSCAASSCFSYAPERNEGMHARSMA